MDNLIKLIVECDIGQASETVISKLCRVKYRLPDIGYYVIEVREEDFSKIKTLDGVKAVHSTARITAQMDRARKTINLRDYSEPVSAQYAKTDANQSHGNRTTRPTGRGIGIAILDTGVGLVRDLCEPVHRIVAFKDFISDKVLPYDDNAHGTHVCGIAAGNGISGEGQYAGVAPESNIIGVKILDSDGTGDTSEVMAGIQWIISNRQKYNIRVANLSVGTSDTGSNAPLVKAVEAAWDRGIVVCVAAGNNGPDLGSVTSPGISRKVITVGSSDDDAPAVHFI